ncbi:GAF domain-containing sensor histidine kinase [Cryptosporangium sp. NPDC051539]|uniref:GAF domain-containing sensor histidine kinase n=1 Tax=Cryptosporangium sp. NPDC051539 TaxID=3363962 RepID=UPI0037AAA187
MIELAALHGLLVGPVELDLRMVARLFTEVFDASGAIVFVVEDATLAVGAAHPEAGAAERALRIPVGYGVAGLVAQNGNSVTIVDDAPRNTVHRTILGIEPGQVVARLCVPAHGLAGAIVAVVSVHRHDRRPFDAADVARAQRLADLVGLRLYAQDLLGAAEEQRSQQDRLIAQAVSAQEAERRRIAGDLHDGVTQALASLTFHLSAAHVGLSGRADDPAARDALADIEAARELAGLAYDETRAAISGLHSPILDDLGLVAALESLTRLVPQLEVEFRGDDPALFAGLPDHASAVLYRIAQEAINNAVKHAEARRVVLSLRRVGDAVVLGITDDGVGFDVQAVREARQAGELGDHFGLSTIAERSALIGATLRIDSVAGRGAAVLVELPLA